MLDQVYKSILLMGPTGVGKTPLGDLIEEQGLKGQRSFHFDFGRNLRKAANGLFPKTLISNEDVAFIENILVTGALLENDTFYIAEKILSAFIDEKQISTEDLIIMNGLPRHIDQAKDTEAMVSIQSVLVLACLPEVVCERIRLNTGGDRTNRKDDSLEEIKNKLDIYARRTLPLIAYFRDQSIPITDVQVDVHTSPQDLISHFSI